MEFGAFLIKGFIRYILVSAKYENITFLTIPKEMPVPTADAGFMCSQGLPFGLARAAISTPNYASMSQTLPLVTERTTSAVAQLAREAWDCLGEIWP